MGPASWPLWDPAAAAQLWGGTGAGLSPPRSTAEPRGAACIAPSAALLPGPLRSALTLRSPERLLHRARCWLISCRSQRSCLCGLHLTPQQADTVDDSFFFPVLQFSFVKMSNRETSGKTSRGSICRRSAWASPW